MFLWSCISAVRHAQSNALLLVGQASTVCPANMHAADTQPLIRYCEAGVHDSSGLSWAHDTAMCLQRRPRSGALCGDSRRAALRRGSPRGRVIVDGPPTTPRFAAAHNSGRTKLSTQQHQSTLPQVLSPENTSTKMASTEEKPVGMSAPSCQCQ